MVNFNDFVNNSASGSIHRHFITFHFANQTASNGGIHRQLVFLNVGFVIAHDLEGFFFFFIHIVQFERYTENHFTTVVDLGDVDDLGITQLAFNFHDTAFGKTLLFAGRMVFGVFFQIGATSSGLSRYFLTDALETLLLGALWVFVLLWVPFYQDMNGGSLGAAIFNEAVFVQLSLVALLSVALLAMGWQGRAHTTKQKTLLVVVALVSVVGWLGRNGETVDINAQRRLH